MAEQNQTARKLVPSEICTELLCLWNTGEVYTVESYARVRRAVFVEQWNRDIPRAHHQDVL